MVGLSDHTLGIGVSVAAIAMGASIIEKHFTLDRSVAGPDSGFSLEPSEFLALVKACREAWQACQPFVSRKVPENLAFRKSLFVSADVGAGDSFSKDNVRIVRPASGLSPKLYPSVLAGSATQDLKAGTPLRREMVSTLC